MRSRAAATRWIEAGARRGLAGLVGLAAAGAPLAARAEGEPSGDISQLAGLIRWSGVLVSVFVIAGAYVLLRFLDGGVARLTRRFVNRRLTLQQLHSVVRFVVFFATGGVVVALSLQLNQTVLALVGGTLAVAVGFALRDLVASVLAGITIMLDRPFQVGDRVQYAGEYGDITAIGLRSVRMQTLDDNTVTIPNNKVLTDVTSSGNYGALDMQVQIDFFIGVDQDIELAQQIVYEGLLTSNYAYLGKPAVVLVKQVMRQDFVCVYLRAKAYVLDTTYEKAFETDVTKRVLSAFREHKILPPAVLHRRIGPAD
ncbi:MAG: mechanosensitive ion channel [Polyangiaceae bacterium]